MIDKKLVDAGFPVVVTKRWSRRSMLLAPTTVTSVRQKDTDQSVVKDDSVGAWVRATGKVWLLNPLLDRFVIAVEAPLRGRASSEAEEATVALAQAIASATSASLDKKAAIPLSAKPPVFYSPPEVQVVFVEENGHEESVEG